MTAMINYAACVRAHGVPTFPDPYIGSDGLPHFSPNAPDIPSSAVQACIRWGRQLPPSAGTDSVPAGDLPALLRFAACMRAHGLPQWPDPLANGDFPVGPGTPMGNLVQRFGKQYVAGQMRTCARYDPLPRGGIYVAPTGR
jgi:hypothetical protein